MKNPDLDIACARRTEFLSCGGGSGQSALDKYRRVDIAIEFMNLNLERQLQISELAGIAKISLSHFFCLFKQRTGFSPIDYLTRMRVWRACVILDSTTARIKEVAIALGYEDAFYFSRVFKSRVALAPTHYRSLGHDVRLQIKERLKTEAKCALDIRAAYQVCPGRSPSGLG